MQESDSNGSIIDIEPILTTEEEKKEEFDVNMYNSTEG